MIGSFRKRKNIKEKPLICAPFLRKIVRASGEVGINTYLSSFLHLFALHLLKDDLFYIWITKALWLVSIEYKIVKYAICPQN